MSGRISLETASLPTSPKNEETAVASWAGFLRKGFLDVLFWFLGGVLRETFFLAGMLQVLNRFNGLFSSSCYSSSSFLASPAARQQCSLHGTPTTRHAWLEVHSLHKPGVLKAYEPLDSLIGLLFHKPGVLKAPNRPPVWGNAGLRVLGCRADLANFLLTGV